MYATMSAAEPEAPATGFILPLPSVMIFIRSSSLMAWTSADFKSLHLHLHHFGYGGVSRAVRAVAGLAGFVVNGLAGFRVGGLNGGCRTRRSQNN